MLEDKASAEVQERVFISYFTDPPCQHIMHYTDEFNTKTEQERHLGHRSIR